MKPLLTIRETACPRATTLAELRKDYDVLIVKQHDDVRLVGDHEVAELLLDLAIQAMKDRPLNVRAEFEELVTRHVIKTRALRRQTVEKIVK